MMNSIMAALSSSVGHLSSSSNLVANGLAGVLSYLLGVCFWFTCFCSRLRETLLFFGSRYDSLDFGDKVCQPVFLFWSPGGLRWIFSLFAVDFCIQVQVLEIIQVLQYHMRLWCAYICMISRYKSEGSVDVGRYPNPPASYSPVHSKNTHSDMSESSDFPTDSNYECKTDYDDSEIDFDDIYRSEEDDCQIYPQLPVAQYDASGQDDQFADLDESFITPGDDRISSLPGEMLEAIAMKLTISEINALSQTSKFLYGCLSDVLYRRGISARFRVRTGYLRSQAGARFHARTGYLRKGAARSRTLLHYAVGSGRIPLRHLLAADRHHNVSGDQSRALLRSINSPDSDYIRPLHSASLVGDSRSVALLLRHGARVNARTFEGHTPLHYAATLANPHVAILLLNSGANRNPRCRHFNYTPLDVAMIHCKNSESSSVVATLRLGGCEGTDGFASKSRESLDSEMRRWEDKRRKEVFELATVSAEVVYDVDGWIPVSSAGHED